PGHRLGDALAVDQRVHRRVVDPLAARVDGVALDTSLAAQIILPGALESVATDEIARVVALRREPVRLVSGHLRHVADEVRREIALRVIAVRLVMDLEAGQPRPRLLDERCAIAPLILENQNRALRIALLANGEPF